jgi:hypothetical protein
MKQITLNLVKYYYSGFISGRAWGGFKGTYNIYGYKDTLEEIQNMTLESLKTGDFQYLDGAYLEIAEVYENDYKQYIDPITIGKIEERDIGIYYNNQ